MSKEEISNALRMSALVIELDKLKHEKKVANKDWNERIKEIDEELTVLAQEQQQNR